MLSPWRLLFYGRPLNFSLKRRTTFRDWTSARRIVYNYRLSMSSFVVASVVLITETPVRELIFEALSIRGTLRNPKACSVQNQSSNP